MMSGEPHPFLWCDIQIYMGHLQLDDAEANTSGDKNKGMVVIMKEESNNLGYQETRNVDIENISSKKQPFWRSIYEVIENSYFEETTLFRTNNLNQCRNNPNEPQNIPSEVKA